MPDCALGTSRVALLQNLLPVVRDDLRRETWSSWAVDLFQAADFDRDELQDVYEAFDRCKQLSQARWEVSSAAVAPK